MQTLNRSHKLLRAFTTTPLLKRTNAINASTNHDSTTQPSVPPPWRPSTVLDEWVAREAHPISLRQLTFFGRSLTEARLLSSANYVRVELPTRIAHRLRDMQTLPYQALTNKHIGHVYELYYSAFEQFRKIPEIRTLDDNDRFCQVIKDTLNQHLSVIPRLAIGVLEIQGSVKSEQCDRFMNTLLRSRISRRVIAEQHLALTDTFHSPWHFPDAKKSLMAPEDDFIGEIFLRCNARELIEKCADIARASTKQAYGPDVALPEIVIKGHLDITFPYIPSHLEYIIGELLRNSIQSTVETFRGPSSSATPPPIEVLVCEAPQHIIIRVSDQAGGVDPEVLPYLWSFAKGPRKTKRLRNLGQVSRLAATPEDVVTQSSQQMDPAKPDSLSPITARPANLRLGIGLPMSRIYAEYWAGSLELHSLEGYGSDAFLQISRLGNKNEVLSTRAMMDAV